MAKKYKFKEEFIKDLYNDGQLDFLSKAHQLLAQRGKAIPGYNIHHIKPKCEGGKDNFNNLTLIKKTTHDAIHECVDNGFAELPQSDGACVFAHLIEQDKQRER